MDRLHNYWYSRFVFERFVAALFLIAFVAANQFVPLLGEHGLEPVGRWVSWCRFAPRPASSTSFPGTPRSARARGWASRSLRLRLRRFRSGTAITRQPRSGRCSGCCICRSSTSARRSTASAGRRCCARSGSSRSSPAHGRMAPNIWLIWIWRWTLFRLMFGAGLIKLRGDPCWRDLTCLNYYFETQPMPNPLSWYFHWMPARRSTRRAWSSITSSKLVVPFAYFAPQPFASIAGIMTIVFQVVLIVRGNLSWLNWLTLVLCIPLISDRWLAWLPVHAAGALDSRRRIRSTVLRGHAQCRGIAEHRARHEHAVAGADDERQLQSAAPGEHVRRVRQHHARALRNRARGDRRRRRDGDSTTWREYEFKGKPGDPARRPPQVAPYHMRLDWLMWFAAMSTPAEHQWFPRLLVKLLEGDPGTLALIDMNPFPDRPPKFVRAVYYEYRFTTPEERRQTGAWWHRDFVGLYYPPVKR